MSDAHGTTGTPGCTDTAAFAEGGIDLGNLNPDSFSQFFDLYLYRGSTLIDSSTSLSSSETVSDSLTAGTTYYVEAYSYSYCGAFRLNIPGGGTGGTTGGGGAPPFGGLLLILIIIAIIAVVVVIIIVVVLVVRRRRRDAYSSSYTDRTTPSPAVRVRCQHCFSIVPSDSSFCPICGNKV